MKRSVAGVLLGLACLALSLSFLTAGGVGVLSAEAGETNDDSSDSSSLPYIIISVDLQGSLPDTAEEFNVVIEAEDSSYPLPDGADEDNGIYVWTTTDDSDLILYFLIDGDSMSNGISISYDSVGVYRYTIYQVSDSFSGSSFDYAVYSLEIYVSNTLNEDGEIIGGLWVKYVLVTLDSDGAEKLDSISFVDVYSTSSTDTSSSGSSSSGSSSSGSSSGCDSPGGNEGEDDEGGGEGPEDVVIDTTPPVIQMHGDGYTGDSSTILLWLIVLIACLAVISYVIFRIRKNSV